MAFAETPRFPVSIALGSGFGPGYSTSIARNLGGYEVNNQNWTMPLYEGDAIHGVKSQADLDDILAFFHGVVGMHKGFRFKDWSDYDAAGVEGTLTVIVANTTWQMYKTYTYGALTKERKITKPVSGTLTIAGGGTYAVDYATGIITRSAGANPTSWTGEFDTPVRFNVDKMLPMGKGRTLFEVGSIPVVELRL